MKRAIEQINTALMVGFVEAHMSAMERKEQAMAKAEQFTDRHGKPAAVGVSTLGATLVVAPYAYAASCNAASDNLLKFITNLANFLIAIGAGLALLMLAVGALFIIGGGTPERVSKGMKMIKNVVIGLAVLGAGMFIKTLTTMFIGDAQKGLGSGVRSPACLKEGKLQ